MEYLQKAIEIGERYGDYHSVSMRKLNLGDKYRKMKDYEKAGKYILEGLEGVRKVGDKYWEAIGYRNLGYTETKETKRLPKITLLVPMICLNPLVQKGRLRKFSLIYGNLKSKGSYISCGQSLCWDHAFGQHQQDPQL